MNLKYSNKVWKMDGIWEGLEKKKGKEKHNDNLKSKKLFCLKVFKKKPQKSILKIVKLSVMVHSFPWKVEI